MALKTNSHVDRMGRYLPFDPSHDQIYEEYQVSKDSLNLETAAFEYVRESIAAGAKVIVLTGDAGHGKTNLCRRILESILGYDEDSARQLVKDKCNGDHSIHLASDPDSSLKLRIFKDFSEFTPSVGASLIEATLIGDDVYIICANEGQLRVVLSAEEAGEHSRKILASFESTFETGKASQDGKIHIVNLNYQSVASGDDGTSLGDRALREWTDSRRWKVCSDCDALNSCPIYRNRVLLSDKVDEHASIRKSKLKLLLATLERIGYVVTIRDMLMAFSYLLTGGLKCADVGAMLSRRQQGWQQEYAFYNLAFEPPKTLTKEKVKRIPALLYLSKLDPGRRAIRDVDEKIVNQQEVFSAGQLDLKFRSNQAGEASLIDAAEGIDEIIGDPRNKKHRAEEAENVTRVVRALRRRAYFDGIASSELDLAHLGFPHGRDFLRLVFQDLDIPEKALLKKRVIAGLHHLQGLQIRNPTPTLHLVDPAFGRSMSGTAILAARIMPRNVDLIRLSDKWGNKKEVEHHVSDSVDWIDRHVILRIIDHNENVHDLSLDLMTFDCILRAAAGHVPTKFYEHDIRRVTGFLGKIAQNAQSNSDQISLLKNGISQTISIDASTIQVADGN